MADCSGCEKRRTRICVWWNSLWPAGTSDMPTGVPRALKLANQLKQHCAKHDLSGEFAGVTVPREE